MEIIYTTSDEMFRVIRKEDGLYYPQEQVISCSAYTGGRLMDMALVKELIANQWSVNVGPWRGWHLGESVMGPYRVSKGYKRYKSAKAAIAFVSNLSAQYQEAA